MNSAKNKRTLYWSVSLVVYSTVYWKLAYPYAKSQTFQWKQYFTLFFIWYQLTLIVALAILAKLNGKDKNEPTLQ